MGGKKEGQTEKDSQLRRQLSNSKEPHVQFTNVNPLPQLHSANADVYLL